MKSISCGEKSSCLLASLLPRRVSTKKFFAWVYWKVFCRFWLIKPRELSHEASAAPIFLGIFFFHSFYGMTLRFESNQGEGYIFESSIICKRMAEVIFFFNWKLNIPSFIFLIWTEQFWIWFSQKLTKNRRNFHRFLKFLLFYPLYVFRILVQIYQSII